MSSRSTLIFVRLLPALLVALSAMSYVAWVEGRDAYIGRNLLPMLMFLVLAWITLRVGKGRWHGGGWGWPLGTLGFALPAIGLSLYMHYGYTIDRDGMFSETVYPMNLFRYLPIYTMFAGGIGFAIGWIAGRNV